MSKLDELLKNYPTRRPDSEHRVQPDPRNAGTERKWTWGTADEFNKQRSS